MSAAVMPVSSSNSRRAHSSSVSSPSRCPFGKSQRSLCLISKKDSTGLPRTTSTPQALICRMELLRQLEVGDEELALMVLGAGAGPHQLLAVGGEDRQHVTAGSVGHAMPLPKRKLAVLDLILRQPEIVIRLGIPIGVISSRPADVRLA